MEFGDLKDHLGLQVHLTWRAMRKRLLAGVRRSGERVSRGTYSIPILIGLNPGVSPLELANALNLDASKIAFFLRDLEKDRLIARRRSKADKRVVELYLTDEGKKFAQAAWAKSHELEGPFTAALSEEDREKLIELLTKLRDNLS